MSREAEIICKMDGNIFGAGGLFSQWSGPDGEMTCKSVVPVFCTSPDWACLVLRFPPLLRRDGAPRVEAGILLLPPVEGLGNIG